MSIPGRFWGALGALEVPVLVAPLFDPDERQWLRTIVQWPYLRTSALVLAALAVAYQLMKASLARHEVDWKRIDALEARMAEYSFDPVHVTIRRFRSAPASASNSAADVFLKIAGFLNNGMNRGAEFYTHASSIIGEPITNHGLIDLFTSEEVMAVNDDVSWRPFHLIEHGKKVWKLLRVMADHATQDAAPALLSSLSETSPPPSQSPPSVQR